MRLWRKAAGALKDKNSLWLANATPRSTIRDPDIEKAVIRATSHNCLFFNYPRIDRVREWLAVSPANLKPLLWAISFRMEKTTDWVVAIKGLYLIHVLLTTNAPCVRRIGRLPFDLSCFRDGHSEHDKAWPFNAFVKGYYAFLDQKSVVLFQGVGEKGNVVMRELVLVQKFQSLIDLLLDIKPKSRAALVPMILDVIDAIIIELYDLHSRVCRGIALVLMNIYSASKAEATFALNAMLKATKQADDLILYMEFSQKIGAVNASEIRVIDHIPEDGIQELKQIIENLSDELHQDETKLQITAKEAEPANNENTEKKKCLHEDHLRTVITDEWEKFDEDKNPSSSVAGSSTIHEIQDLIILEVTLSKEAPILC